MPSDQMSFGWEDPKQSPAAPPIAPRMSGLAQRLHDLARHGIYLGTSSWKYPGWLGQLYQPGGYQVRGKFSQRKFEQTCLTEYARVFSTVGGDFSFYQFPSDDAWRDIFQQVGPGFRLCPKVPEEITVERYPDMPRYGARAGQPNPHFMDAAMFREKFLTPLAPYRDKLGALIFEFGTIHDGPYHEPRGFAKALDLMLGDLPRGDFSYSVEVRNREFLKPESGYLDTLKNRGVAHCLSSWTRMPPFEEQMEVPNILTAPHVAARLLLRPGRSYEQAVKKLAPYERVIEPYAELRAALRRLIEICKSSSRALVVLVNNRLEGNAIETIAGSLDEIATSQG